MPGSKQSGFVAVVQPMKGRERNSFGQEDKGRMALNNGGTCVPLKMNLEFLSEAMAIYGSVSSTK